MTFNLPAMNSHVRRTAQQRAGIASKVAEHHAKKKAKAAEGKPWTAPEYFAGIYITSCRFPLWGDTVTHEYCGKPTEGGISYCPHHQKITRIAGSSYLEMERLRKRTPERSRDVATGALLPSLQLPPVSDGRGILSGAEIQSQATPISASVPGAGPGGAASPVPAAGGARLSTGAE